jgi:hypothetical protein
MKPSELCDYIELHPVAGFEELPFQEGRSLTSVKKPENSTVLVNSRTRNYTPKREDDRHHRRPAHRQEGTEDIDLVDYGTDKYDSGTLDQHARTAGVGSSFSDNKLLEDIPDDAGTTKMRDEDDAREERHRIKNAKRAECRQRVAER